MSSKFSGKILVSSVLATVASALKPTITTTTRLAATVATRRVIQQHQDEKNGVKLASGGVRDVAENLFLVVALISMMLGVLFCSYGILVSHKKEALEEEAGEGKDAMQVHFERYT